MILPPFYGYNISYQDREIYKIYNSYLSQDLLSYNKPTQTIISTYLSQDVLTYTKQFPVINVTYLSADILCYAPPPTVPNAPSFVFARDWDSSADLMWTQPSSPRAPVTGYNIQYSGSNSNNWIDYGIFTTLSQYITGLTNNIEYKFKVAGINSYGTGLYSLSNSITPSGGDDSYCKLALYLPLDNDIFDKSCNTKNTNIYLPSSNSIELTTSEYKYGSGSLFMNGIGYSSNTEYPHLVVGSGQNINWNFAGDFTIEMFVKPLNDSATGTMLSIKQQTVNNTGLVKLHSSGNTIIFDFNQNNYNNTIIASGYSLLLSSWSHFAVVRSNNIIKMYINGEHAGNMLNTSITPYLSGAIITIGADSSPVSDVFGGYFDQILILNSAKYRKNFIPSEYTVEEDCNCGYSYSYSYSSSMYNNTNTTITWE